MSPKSALTLPPVYSHGGWTSRQRLEAHLSSTSLFILPRNVVVNEVNLLRVSISWSGQGTSASSWRPQVPVHSPSPLARPHYSLEPSSLRSLGPRGSRASSEIRNESSENSSVDCKCRSAEMGEPLQSARGHRVQGLWSATKLPLPQDPWRRGGRGQLGPLVTRRFGGSS